MFVTSWKCVALKLCWAETRPFSHQNMLFGWDGGSKNFETVSKQVPPMKWRRLPSVHILKKYIFFLILRVWCSEFYFYILIFKVWFSKFDFQSLIFKVWFSKFDFQSFIFKVWFSKFDFQCLRRHTSMMLAWNQYPVKLRSWSFMAVQFTVT